MRRAELYVLLAAENRIVRGEATKNLHHAPTLDRGAFGRSADRDEELTTRQNVNAGRGLPRQHRSFAATADLHSLDPGIARLPPRRHDVMPLTRAGPRRPLPHQAAIAAADSARRTTRRGERACAA
jgi:hypothetical protein